MYRFSFHFYILAKLCLSFYTLYNYFIHFASAYYKYFKYIIFNDLVLTKICANGTIYTNEGLKVGEIRIF